MTANSAQPTMAINAQSSMASSSEATTGIPQPPPATSAQPSAATSVRPLTAASSQLMIAIDAFHQDAWTKQDPLLPNDWAQLTPEWHHEHALGADHARRQAHFSSDEPAASYRLAWRDNLSDSRTALPNNRARLIDVRCSTNHSVLT